MTNYFSFTKELQQKVNSMNIEYPLMINIELVYLIDLIERGEKAFRFDITIEGISELNNDELVMQLNRNQNFIGYDLPNLVSSKMVLQSDVMNITTLPTAPTGNEVYHELMKSEYIRSLLNDGNIIKFNSIELNNLKGMKNMVGYSTSRDT